MMDGIIFNFYSITKNMAQYSAQILKTLSEQVQNLAPLRESFRHLQSYYAKLTKEFNDLLEFGVWVMLFRIARRWNC